LINPLISIDTSVDNVHTNTINTRTARWLGATVHRLHEVLKNKRKYIPLLRQFGALWKHQRRNQTIMGHQNLNTTGKLFHLLQSKIKINKKILIYQVALTNILKLHNYLTHYFSYIIVTLQYLPINYQRKSIGTNKNTRKTSQAHQQQHIQSNKSFIHNIVHSPTYID
jgi:hypothetical protein